MMSIEIIISLETTNSSSSCSFLYFYRKMTLFFIAQKSEMTQIQTTRSSLSVLATMQPQPATAHHQFISGTIRPSYSLCVPIRSQTHDFSCRIFIYLFICLFVYSVIYLVFFYFILSFLLQGFKRNN